MPQQIRATIDAEQGRQVRATCSRASTPHEATETTHYSIVDEDGNAVAVTYTINGCSAPR